MTELPNKIVETVNKVIDNKVESEQIKLELVKELNSSTLEKAKIDAKVRLAILERGALPLVIYVFMFLIVWNSVLVPILMSFGVKIVTLPIDDNLYQLIQFITGSVFVKKTADNVSTNLTKPKG